MESEDPMFEICNVGLDLAFPLARLTKFLWCVTMIWVSAMQLMGSSKT